MRTDIYLGSPKTPAAAVTTGESTRLASCGNPVTPTTGYHMTVVTLGGHAVLFVGDAWPRLTPETTRFDDNIGQARRARPGPRSVRNLP